VVVDDDLISGATTGTLTFLMAEPQHEGKYRVVIEDSDLGSLTSDDARVTVSVQPEGCVPGEVPLGDFATQAGFEEWVAEHLDDQDPPVDYDGTWDFVVSYTYFESNLNGEGGDNGRVIKHDALIPVGSEAVAWSFLQAAYDGPGSPEHLPLRLEWGPGLDQGHDFDVPLSDSSQVFVVDLSAYPSWQEGEAQNGFYQRDITLKVRAPHFYGKLTRADFLPGPHLVFRNPPDLLLGSSEARLDFLCEGIFLRIDQEIKNTGCDMGDYPDALEERAITYTLCRQGDPNDCHNELFPGGDPDGSGLHMIIPGVMDMNDYDTFRIGGFYTPPPGDWVLTGTFDNERGKASTRLLFTILTECPPNLQVDMHFTIDASQGGTRRSWLTTSEGSFDITFAASTNTYDAVLNVPVEVYGRAYKPGQTPPGWQLIASETIPELAAYGGSICTIENVTIPTFDGTWALMDVRITLDPYDDIDEGEPEYELDNDGEVTEWIPVVVSDIATDIGDSMHQDDFDGGFNEITPGSKLLDVELNSYYDSMVLRYHPEGDPSKDDQPYLWWNLDGIDSGGNFKDIGGVMVRYQRTFVLVGGHMAARRHEGAHQVGDPDPGPPFGTSIDLEVPERFTQWHTILWQNDGTTNPFPSSVPNLWDDDDDLDPKLASESPIESLFLGLDANYIGWNPQCPSTYVDYLGVWSTAEPIAPDLWDAEPAELMYLFDDSTKTVEWRVMHRQVYPDTEWLLGVQITGLEEHELLPAEVIATISVNGEPPQYLEVQQPEIISDGSAVYPLWVDPTTPEWLAEPSNAMAVITVTLNITDSNEDHSNNTQTFTVTIVAGECDTIFAMPVAVSGGR
jgi:hypothetical protein